jgi:hypothetical protein
VLTLRTDDLLAFGFGDLQHGDRVITRRARFVQWLMRYDVLTLRILRARIEEVASSGPTLQKTAFGA